LWRSGRRDSSRNRIAGPVLAFILLNGLRHQDTLTAHQNRLDQAMTQLFRSLYRDDAGFIVSAELVLVATILVIGLVVGLSAVSAGVNSELQDVGSAFGSVNQSYSFSGYSANAPFTRTPPQAER
jgi:Flp pilus assembly pilin Flp